jgi:hypothetical protein
MLLAAILMVFSAPQSVNTVNAETNAPAVVVVISKNAANESFVSQSLPSAPRPKIATDDASATAVDATSNVTAGVELIEPSYTLSAPISNVPTKAFIGRSYRTSRQRKLWYALSFTGAGAACLDAWSTRRAITRGVGVEGNPMLRPFSHSGVLYAATQVSPLVMDLIGKRMMTSQHPLLRKVWWLPQAVGSAVSVSAAIHNVRMVP